MQCKCCFEDTVLNNVIVCTENSSHTFCFQCASSNLERIVNTGTAAMNCMYTSACTGYLKEEDIRKYASEQLLDRFYRLQQQIYLRSTGDDIVSCPFCSLDMIKDNDIVNDILVCVNNECGKSSCILCKKDSHWPQPCSNENYERTRSEEEQTYSIVKTCPSCNVDILKNGGCNHVTCTGCGRDMCYVCGIDITGRVAQHPCPVYNADQDMTRELRRRHPVQVQVQDARPNAIPYRDYQVRNPVLPQGIRNEYLQYEHDYYNPPPIALMQYAGQNNVLRPQHYYDRANYRQANTTYENLVAAQRRMIYDQQEFSRLLERQRSLDRRDLELDRRDLELNRRYESLSRQVRQYIQSNR